MELPIFYCPPEKKDGDVAYLSEEESHHALRVMRLGLHDYIMVVDGLGTAFKGEIVKIRKKKEVEVRLLWEVRNFGEPMLHLTLAAGLSAGSKFDTVIQKGTELGVKRFVPIVSELSKVSWDTPKKAAAKVRRLERVALAAIKQCRRSYRPDISSPMTLADYVSATDENSLRLIFHPGGKVMTEVFPSSLRSSQPPKRVAVLVGPESGFTEEEVNLALAHEFVPVSLGSRILRTETAGPVACALVMNLLGELS